MKSIPLPRLLKKAEKVFNAYIRQRDDGCPCISCGRFRELQAGHFIPVSKSSFLRFHEWNVNGECAGCNGFDDSHLIGYNDNLINKIGLKAVKWLKENRHQPKKWTREELNQIIKKYGTTKNRGMEKADQSR